MQDFLAAIGLVLVVEGLVYGGFPGLAKRLAGEVLSMPENALRIAGLAAIAIGVGIVWLVRGVRTAYGRFILRRSHSRKRAVFLANMTRRGVLPKRFSLSATPGGLSMTSNTLLRAARRTFIAGAAALLRRRACRLRLS